MNKNSVHIPGVTIGAAMLCLGLRLEPAAGGLDVAPAVEGMTRQKFQRQLGALGGYLARAAALRGEKPLRLTETDVPEREGPETLFWLWYAKAAAADSDRRRVLDWYNALGALPGGFSAVEENGERWLGGARRDKLLEYVRTAKYEENDLGENTLPMPDLPGWTAEELAALERGVLRAGLDSFADDPGR